ncbi:MAG TPA: TetR/AcrR family transcriptional regulator [Gemmatimonadaceae bacterium]|nr:TetR/AcrR family transcriptional regulator [Gemmatimonadaceae bacterium]
MGSRERRTRERAETRQRILEAARKLFVREGVEATTMRAIAEEIEYTPTAIYHHFPSKQALLVELCNIDFRALAAAFLRIGRVDDPIERLRRIGEAYVSFALEHPMQYQLLFMTRHPSVSRAREQVRGDPSEDAYAFLRDTCAEVIATGRLRDEFSDPEEVAQMAWSSLHGLIALRIVKEDDPWIEWRDVGRTAARMGESLIRGMHKGPGD